LIINILNSVKTHWFLVTVIWLIVITIASLYPADSLPQVPGSDKTHHFIAYMILVFPLALAKPKNYKTYILLLILFGGFIEIVQPYVNRYGEWLDFLANSLGICLGIVLAFFINYLLYKK
jgi:VanZ family protein